jgi:predicted nucleic acid-binding protein
MIVFLDSGVLGKLCNPNKKGEAAECENWLFGLLARGIYVVTSDICDYEVRRSLILESKKKSNINNVESLDELKEIVTFLPLTTKVLLKASELWATAREQGIPTADDKNLDADIIICAQWQLLSEEYPGRYIAIATTNVKHLSSFTEAKIWQDLKIF